MFKGRLKQEAVYKPLTGTDLYGKPSFGTERTTKCRIEKELKLVRSESGEIYESTTTFFLPFLPLEGSSLVASGDTKVGIIKAVGDNPGLGGVTSIWEAYC